MILGGVVAGQGKIDVDHADRDRVGARPSPATARASTSGAGSGATSWCATGPRVQITEERLETVERFFDRHGGKAIFIGRFVGLVRAIAPFLAGSGGMPFRRFLPYDILGAGLWATTFILLGYFFWQQPRPRPGDRQAGRLRARRWSSRDRRGRLAGSPLPRARRTAPRFEAGLWRALDRPLAAPAPARRPLASRPGALLPRAPDARPARPRADEPAGDRRGRLVRVHRLLARASPTARCGRRPAVVAEWRSDAENSTALVDIVEVLTVLGDPLVVEVG